MQGQKQAKQPARNGDRGEGGTSGKHEKSSSRRSILRTSANLGETVEHAIAPITLLIWSEWTVQGVLVAACDHRDGALRKNTDAQRRS